jgi:hypothetical protein
LPSANSALQAQAQAQLAAAMASGNPAAIAASKHSLNMLSMQSLHEPTANFQLDNGELQVFLHSIFRI